MTLHTILTIVTSYIVNERVDINRIADEVGFSTRHLHALFCEYMAMKPKHFLESMRLHKAVALLADGMALQEVCAHTGYACAKTLRNALKRRLGKTPTCIRLESATASDKEQLLLSTETQLFTRQALLLLQQHAENHLQV